MAFVKLIFGSWADLLDCHPKPNSARCQLIFPKVLSDELLWSLTYSSLYFHNI